MWFPDWCAFTDESGLKGVVWGRVRPTPSSVPITVVPETPDWEVTVTCNRETGSDPWVVPDLGSTQFVLQVYPERTVRVKSTLELRLCLPQLRGCTIEPHSLVDTVWTIPHWCFLGRQSCRRKIDPWGPLCTSERVLMRRMCHNPCSERSGRLDP